jgi:hypothetical protein
MAEAEEVQGAALEIVRVEGARARSVPRKARTGVRQLLKEAAEEMLGNNIAKFLACLMKGIEGNHLPSARMLFELTEEPDDDEEFLEDGCLSLAEVLWKELEDGKTGTGE